MTRRPISSKRRLELFTAQSGVCNICRAKIQVGQAWDVDHEIPLAMGGDDGGDNLKVVHAKCHRGTGSKTADDDMPRIAKTKRMQAKFTGAWPRSRTPLRSRGFPKRTEERDMDT